MAERGDQASRREYGWGKISGPVAVLAAVLALEVFRRAAGDPQYMPSVVLIVLLSTTLFAAFQTGLRIGLTSAAIAILYAAFAFSTPGQPFHYGPESEVRRLLVLGPSLAAIALVVGTLRDRVDRILASEHAVRVKVEQAARWSAFLAESGRLLSSSLDYEATLKTLVDLAVPTLADWAGVDTLTEDGEVRFIAGAHADPSKLGIVREIRRRYPPVPEAGGGAAKVLRTGEPELYPYVSDEAIRAFVRDERDLELFREAGLRSAMIVPLIARGRILGLLALAAGRSGRRYGEDDLARALDLAARAALAVDNARLYENAELEERRSRFLADASRVLASSLDYRVTLETVARLAVPALADYCLIDLVEPRKGPRRVASVHRDPEAERRLYEATRYRADRAENPSAQTLRTGEPALVARIETPWWDAEAFSRGAPLVRALEPKSAMVVPLSARDQTLGVMTFAMAESDREYGPDDLALAEEVARRAAVAVDHARLYETALKASQAKTDFLAVMSHELRTPLNAIMGYADLLRSGVTGALTDEQNAQVSRVEANARHLLALIEEILTFSRVEGGKEAIGVERVDLFDIVRQVAAMVEPLATEKGLAFRVSVPETPEPVDTDSDKIRQILFNLATNAIKFTDDGEVVLRAETRNGDVVLQVQDTGIGIPAGYEDRIFEPFWQVEQGATRRAGGTGLGLTVTKRLAQMLGGDVEVDSEPGRGSTFTVRLPVLPVRRSGDS